MLLLVHREHFPTRDGRLRSPAILCHVIRCYSLTATTEADGAVTFVAENGEISAEDTVEILYKPPEGMFRDSDSLMYCGGFNGWDGEDEALTAPMIPTDDGRFRVTVAVPNFAKVTYAKYLVRILLLSNFLMNRRSPHNRSQRGSSSDPSFMVLHPGTGRIATVLLKPCHPAS